MGIHTARTSTVKGIGQVYKTTGEHSQMTPKENCAHLPDFRSVGVRVNGGTTGLAERTAFYNASQKVLVCGEKLSTNISRGLKPVSSKCASPPNDSQNGSDSPKAGDK